MVYTHRTPHCPVLSSCKGLRVLCRMKRVLTYLLQLMGHEIVILLVGFTWGFGVGFGIACAGTYLGEIATF
jgi:hypothetical protein